MTLPPMTTIAGEALHVLGEVQPTAVGVHVEVIHTPLNIFVWSESLMKHTT